jgi:hypothetical protein
MSDLEDLRDSLSQSLQQLLDERDAAVAKGDTAKVNAAEAEADRIGVVLATVQFAISNQQAMNMNAVAARLQESIEAQKAIGLSLARKTLEGVVAGIKAAGPGDVAGAVAGDVQAKPGKNQFVVDSLIAGAKDEGLDPILVLAIVGIESDFKPTAQNPVSSAGGLFQFIDKTWIAEGGKKFPGRGGIGNGHAAAAPIDMQIEIGTRFIAELASNLKSKLKIVPTPTTVYMAHQQGTTNAIAILKADPSAAIESIIGDDAARNNAFGGMTVAQTIAKFNAMVRSHEAEARALVTMVGAVAPAGSAAGGAADVTPKSIVPKAVNIALSELETFARQNGGIVTETNAPLRARVLEYFRLVGRGDITDPSAEPWSAAFISFVMRSAGATEEQFPFSQGHFKYILVGLANRMANRFDAPVVYFDRDEKAPRIGDLIGFSRTSSVRNRSDLEEFLPNKFFPSHTDLVIDVSPGKLKVIGGNVSQTIMTKTVKTDSSGKIDSSDEHFFVLRTSF